MRRRVKIVLGWNIAIWGERVDEKKNHKNNFSHYQKKTESLWLEKLFFCLLIVCGNYSTKRKYFGKKLMVISWQDKISLLHFFVRLSITYYSFSFVLELFSFFTCKDIQRTMTFLSYFLYFAKGCVTKLTIQL